MPSSVEAFASYSRRRYHPHPESSVGGRASGDPMRNRRKCILAALWVCAPATLALSAALGAQPPSPYDVEPSERLAALVERMRFEQDRLQTLEAGFVQRKQSLLLLEPEVATGIFSYESPDRVRWEYHEPNPISLLIDGDQMTTWYRDLDQVEEVEIGRHSQRVLEYLGAGSSLARLLEYFEVTLSLPDDRSQPMRLELEPKFERVARRIEGMKIWVDPGTFLPLRLRYTEPDGDLTDYQFADYSINGELPSERFELDLPSGVQVRTIDLRRAGLQ